MPTMLPDMAARARHHHHLTLARLTPIVVAVFYLLLLAWNAATLEASFNLLFGHHQLRGEYTPMEPSPIAERRATAVPDAR